MGTDLERSFGVGPGETVAIGHNDSGKRTTITGDRPFDGLGLQDTENND